MNLFRKISRARDLLSIIRNQYWGLLNIPKVDNLDDLLSKYNVTSLGIENAITLDIGCGLSPSNPFKAQNVFGVDIRSNNQKNVKSADLVLEPIPFPDNMFDYITAHDFLEHIPRIIYTPKLKFAFVEVMNEVWRTLKPNGIFLSRTPIYPYVEAFRDPTHVNIITYETFTQYFSDSRRMATMYGFRGSFIIVAQYLKPPYLISILRKAV